MGRYPLSQIVIKVMVLSLDIFQIVIRNVVSETTPRIISFYQYHPLTELEVTSLRDRLLHDLGDVLSIKGRIYISCEGINGSIMLPSREMTPTTPTNTLASSSFILFKIYMETLTPFKGLLFNPSWEQNILKVAFDKLHVRVRKQLVADNLMDFKVTPENEPEYLSPEQFHHHIQDIESSNNTILLDIRNHYER